MTKVEEQEIIKTAFVEELYRLEKTAAWSSILTKMLPRLVKGLEWGGKNLGKGNLSKYLSSASRHFNPAEKGGWKKGIDFVKGYSTPSFSKLKGGSYTSKEINKRNSGMLQKILGNTARELEFLGKGIKSNKGFVANAKTFGKNLKEDTIRSFNSARFKTVKPEKLKLKNFSNTPQEFTKKTIFGKNKKYVKTRFGFKRQVVGKTSKDNYIIKKRALPAAGAIAVTPAGMAVSSTLGGDPKEGLADYFKWKTPLGPAELIADLPDIAKGFSGNQSY